MQFVIIAVIPTVVYLDFYSFDPVIIKANFDSLFDNSQDQHFNWWKKIGVPLCVTMMMSTIKPYLTKMFWPCLKWYKRLRDRSCKSNIKKVKGDHECEKVNTKLTD